MALNPKQKRFALEYLIDLNATQAAIRAGYSKKTAKEQGSKLLTKVNIQEAIQKGQKKIADKIDVTIEKIVQEYARIGFSNMRDYVKWNSDDVVMIDSEKLTPNQSAAVLEVSQTLSKDGGTLKIKLHDKKGALDSLARHLGMFADKNTDIPDDFTIHVTRKKSEE